MSGEPTPIASNCVIRCRLQPEAQRDGPPAEIVDETGRRHREGDAGVSEQHALVLVNHGGASGRQLLDLAHRVAASVHETFGVHLEPEPTIVGP